MSQKSSADRPTFLDKSFLASVVLGPAASYSNLYLFHVLLGAKFVDVIWRSLRGGRVWMPHRIRPDLLFFGIFVAWYALSILWAPNTTYAIRYVVYVFLGVSTAVMVAVIGDGDTRIRATFRVLAIMMCLQLLVGVVEGLGWFRFPTSPFSEYRQYFGRAPSDLSRFRPDQIEFLMYVPTGFAGNTNNLAMISVLILPFFLFYKRTIVSIIGTAAVLFVLAMGGARIAMLAFCLTTIVAIVVHFIITRRLHIVAVLATVACAALLSGVGSSTFRLALVGEVVKSVESMASRMQPATDDVSPATDSPTKNSAPDASVPQRNDGTASAPQNEPVAGSSDTGSPGTASSPPQAVVDGCHDDGGKSSVAIRLCLIMNGIDALIESNGVGVGAGGSQAIQEEVKGSHVRITSMHNVWIELLVEGGVVFVLLFAAWYVSLLWRLWGVVRAPESTFHAYMAVSLFVSLIALTLNAVGPSSVIYSIPMWGFIGLCLATIEMAKRPATLRIFKAGAAEATS